MALSLKQEKFVAAYVGPANGNATEAARLAGYKGTAKTLASVGSENLAKPEIAEAVAAYRTEVRRQGIRALENRLDEYEERWRLMRRLRVARAEDEAIRRFPGGDTGLLVPTVKQIGGGDTAERVEEAELDTGYLREMRELEKQASQETGQWTEKKEIAGAGGGPLEILGFDVPAPPPPVGDDA